MPDNPPTYQRFLAELKRRKVFRVMAVYGATAFVLLQVADLLAEGMGLPDTVLRVTTFLVLIGFPIAVVLAWAYEMTPDGVRKTEEAESGELTEIIAAPVGARWPSGLLALAGVIMLAVGGWLTVRSTGVGDASDPAAAAPAAAQLASESPAADDGRRTIAVLPFENMTGGMETEPFVVGVHDDVLTHLSKIKALKVTSRTSVKEYRDTQKPIPEIASELGVETVLEGGVQRSGDMVRINVQLIDPATDEHLWAETYDAELTAENVFAIQSQIARSVAEALEAELSPAEIETLADVPTRNLDALAAYHEGTMAFDARGSLFNDSIAVAAFERAVVLDPEFVPAWTGLAMMISWQANMDVDADTARAREAIVRADAIAPGSADVELARGYFKYYAMRDFEGALGHFRAAEDLRPSDSGAAEAIALILRRLGDWEGSVEYSWRAIELDPRNVGRYNELVETLTALRRYRTADAVVERGLIVEPGHLSLKGWKLNTLLALDRAVDRASSYSAELALVDQADMDLAYNRALIAGATGDQDEAIRLVETAGQGAMWENFLRDVMVGQSEWLLGNSSAARAAGQRVLSQTESVPQRSGVHHGLAALGHSFLADSATATELAGRGYAQALAGEPVDAQYGYYFSAKAMTIVGDQKGAAGILAHVATVPSMLPSLAELELFPVWEGLRQSPEFPAVLAAFEAAEAEGARRDTEAGY